MKFTPPVTLAGYFREHVWTDEGRTMHVRKDCRNAANRFARFLAQTRRAELPIADITPEILQEFDQWSVDRNGSTLYVKKTGLHVRAMLRSFDSEHPAIVTTEPATRPKRTSKAVIGTSRPAEAGPKRTEMPLSDFAGRYVQSHDLAQASIDSLKFAVDALHRYTRQPISTKDLSAELLNAWVESRLKDGRALKTVAGQRRTILCLWREAHRNGLAPSLPPRGEVKRVPRPTLAPDSFVGYVDRFLLARDVTAQYAGQLRARAKRLDQWAGRTVLVADLTDELVNGFLASLTDKVSPETVRGYRCNLLALWNGAFDDRLTDIKPGRIRTPKIPERVTEAWDHGELVKLLAAAAKTRGHFSFGSRKAEWFTAFILVAYASALRLSDLLKLKWSDLSPDGRLTLIQNKTGRRHTVTLGTREIAAIRAIRWDGPELIPWPVRQDAFYAHFRALISAAGLFGTTKYLRRSGASYAELERPGDGSRLLGHRSPQLFRENYECQRITQPDVARPRAIPKDGGA